MATYTYSIEDDFPQQKVAAGKLKSDIQSNTDITKTLSSVDTDGDVCSIVFTSALSGAEETELDDMVAAHQGVDVQIVFHATSKLVNDPVVITEDQNWQVLGGVVTNLQFFVPDLTKALGRVVGSIKTEGTGVQLRVVEDNGTSDLVMNEDPVDVPDHDDVWTPVKFSTNVPARGGDSTYRVEGRLNGATSASVRFVSMTLLELKVVE